MWTHSIWAYSFTLSLIAIYFSIGLFLYIVLDDNLFIFQTMSDVCISSHTKNLSMKIWHYLIALSVSWPTSFTLSFYKVKGYLCIKCIIWDRPITQMTFRKIVCMGTFKGSLKGSWIFRRKTEKNAKTKDTATYFLRSLILRHRATRELYSLSFLTLLTWTSTLRRKKRC